MSHLMTQLGRLSYQWIMYEPDRTDGHAYEACGPMTVALAGHVLLRVPLPQGRSAIQAFSDIRQKRFVMNLPDSCITPGSWAWWPW